MEYAILLDQLTLSLPLIEQGVYDCRIILGQKRKAGPLLVQEKYLSFLFDFLSLCWSFTGFRDFLWILTGNSPM